MASSITGDLKRLWHRHTLNKIIMVNLALFLAVNAVRLIFFIGSGGGQGETSLYHTLIHGLSISSEPWRMIALPWTWITHMFLHEGLWHIGWNMLLLYWFGRIIGDFIGDRRVLPIYLLSGLLGAIFFVVSYYVLPAAGIAPFALGASAAVLGIIMATAAVAPDYEMRLILLGPVKIKWIAAFVIALNLIQVSSLGQTGSSMGHLGGILGGYLCIRGLRGGQNWVDALADIIDRWRMRFTAPRTPRKAKKSSPLQVVHKQKTSKVKTEHRSRTSRPQDRVDELLDKIRASGYDSLTPDEKEELRKASES